MLQWLDVSGPRLERSYDLWCRASVFRWCCIFCYRCRCAGATARGFSSTCWKPCCDAASRWSRRSCPPLKTKTAPSASRFLHGGRTYRKWRPRWARRWKMCPSFLPPQVNAMLRAGEKLGDLKKVLPACREVLRIAPDTVRSTTHYMVAILLVFAPAARHPHQPCCRWPSFPNSRMSRLAWACSCGRSPFSLLHSMMLTDFDWL
jgi:hypothetical protein